MMKKTMKRLLGIGLSAVMVLSMAACGNDTQKIYSLSVQGSRRISAADNHQLRRSRRDPQQYYRRIYLP